MYFITNTFIAIRFSLNLLYVLNIKSIAFLISYIYTVIQIVLFKFKLNMNLNVLNYYKNK